MFFYKKILIVIIVVLFSYLLLRLRHKRMQIIQEYADPVRIESFTGSIRLNNPYPQDLKLSDYCIKASLNSALNSKASGGPTMDCDPKNPNNILKTVLERGVRFLDFEVFSTGGEPVIGYSSSYDATNTNNEASNSPKDTFIQLNIVFKTILSLKPANVTDPLFIQLRIKTQKTELYSKIANYITQIFEGALFSGTINESTILSEINNKIIIVMDIKNSNPSYSSASRDFKSLVNLETGKSLTVITTAELLKSNAKRININKDGVTISANEESPTWKLTYPDIMDSMNPDIKTLMQAQCPNIIQCRFDLEDNNLDLYEKIFTNQAFMPLGSAFKTASKW